MPRTTQSFTLESKRDALTDRLNELAEQVAGGDASEDALQEASRVERHRDAIADAVDEYGEHAEVTIGALTAGEYGQAKDYVKDSQLEKSGQSVDGVSQIVYVAQGVQTAPFLDAATDTDGAVAAVSQLAPALVEFLEAEIDDLTTPSGNGHESFADLLAAKQDDTASREQ